MTEPAPASAAAAHDPARIARILKRLSYAAIVLGAAGGAYMTVAIYYAPETLEWAAAEGRAGGLLSRGPLMPPSPSMLMISLAFQWLVFVVLALGAFWWGLSERMRVVPRLPAEPFRFAFFGSIGGLVVNMIMQGPLPMPGRVVAENLAPDSLMLEIFLGPLTTLWAAVTFAVTATGMRYDALQKDPEQPFWPSRETIRKTQRRRYAQALRKLAAKRQAQEPDSQARAAARRTQKRMISVLAIPIAGASLALRLLGAGVFVASFYEPSLQLAPPYAQEKLTLSVAAYASVMLVLAILPALFALLAAVGNAGWAPALRRFHRWASFALLVHILSLMASIAHMGLSSFPVVYYMPVSTIPRLMSVYLGVPEDPLAFVVALESGALVAVIYLQPRWSGGGKKRKT